MIRSAPRVVAAVAGIALLAASCSTGPTLKEYGEAIEALVAEMDAEHLALSNEVQSAEPTIEEARAFFDRRAAIFADFVAALRMLEPPPAAEEVHTSALRVLDRRAEADRAFAAELASQALTQDGDDFFKTLSSLEQSDVVAELVEADAEMIELCRAAQARFDATEEQAALEGVPWVPPELKEVVRVTFNCDEVPG